MPHKKSAKERVVTNEASRMRNVARRSDIKTACRKVIDALAGKDVQGASTLLKDAESKMQKKTIFRAAFFNATHLISSL